MNTNRHDYTKDAGGVARNFALGHTTAGFSTIEILIAFAVGIVFLSAAMMVAFSDASLTEQVSVDSGHAAALDTMLDNGGVYRSQNRIGDLQNALASNWNTVFSMTSTTDDIYTYKPPAVHDISPCIKHVSSETNWSSLNNRNRTVTMDTIVSDMNIAKALGPGGCDPTPPSGGGHWWDNPTDTGWNVASSQLSGSGSGIAVLAHDGILYAFITTWQNGNPNTPDVWPIDISDSEHPSPKTGLNTGKGLKGIALGGTYAYVIQNDSTNQFQVIDISEPTHLVASSIKANKTLPNMTSAVIPTTIAYYNGYIYIGTPYIAFGIGAQNRELHVYCVSDTSISGCTPSTPVWMGSYNVNHNVNDISIEQRRVSGVMKTYAFLATSDASGGYAELTIFDVTNPNSISLAGSLALPGNFYGTSVYVLGNKVYLGRQRATGNNHDFYVIDISGGVSTPVVLKQMKLGLSPNTAVTKIFVHGNLAFILTSDTNKPFEVWDIASNPSSIVAVSTCVNTVNIPVSADLAYYNDLIYVVNQNEAAMHTIHDEASTCN